MRRSENEGGGCAHLAATVNRYLRHRASAGLAPATVRHDGAELARLVRWMAAERLTWAELTRARIAPYIARVRARRCRAGRRKGQPISKRMAEAIVLKLRVFFRWLVDEEVMLASPMVGFHTKVPRAICGWGVFTRDEVARLFDHLTATDPITLRDRAVIAVLYGAGLRVGELARLTLADYDADAGELWIRQAKGKKDRTVPLGPAARADLDRYLAHARPELAHRRGHAFLFVNSRGNPARIGVIQNHFKRVQRQAGLTRVLGPHAMRHAFATHMLEEGADLRALQELLGHASLVCTGFYTHVDLTDLRRALAHAHPRERGDE